jgi:hypothetical protein
MLHKYENRKEKLAPRHVYMKRVIRSFLLGTLIITFWLGLGILGYRITIPEFDFYDSLLNASMILGGMGPLIGPDIKMSHAAKIFASFYAIISGIIFISAFTILITPMAHRFFHKLHLEDNQ